MRRHAIVTVLLAAALAHADRLESTDRGRLEGKLQEAILVVDGLPRIYPAELLATIELSESGDDRAILRNGTAVRGQVRSVAFKAGQRLYVLTRSKLVAIALDGARADVPARADAAALSADQQQALAASERRHEAYSRRVTERHNTAAEALKRKHRPQWDALSRKVASLERKNGRGLKKAQAELDRLRKTIGAAVATLDDAAERQRSLLASVAGAIRSEVMAGQIPTERQMMVRYDAAMAGRLMGQQPRRIVIRTLDAGVTVRVGRDRDRPELIVDPFPEEGD